jgi:hypothetical protein
LGSTGVALSRDTSTAFLNPATLGALDNPTVAFSVNVARITYFDLANYLQPGAPDTSVYGNFTLPQTGVTRFQFSALPSSLCLYLLLGNDPFADNAHPPGRLGGGEFLPPLDSRPRLAFCYATTELSSIFLPAQTRQLQSAPYTSQQAQGLSSNFQRYHMGPTLAFNLSERISFGASLHGIVSDFDTTYAAGALTYQGASGLTSSLNFLRSGVSVDLALAVGLTYRIDDKNILGLNVYSPTAHVYGLYNAGITTITTSAASSATRLDSENGQFHAYMPPRIALGYGRDFGRFRIEADAFFVPSVGDAFRLEGQSSRTAADSGLVTTSSTTFNRLQPARAVVNGAIGAEYFFSPSFALLTGVATDFSPIALPSERPTFESPWLAALDRVALSVGFGSYGALGDVLFGAEMSYQWGKIAAPNLYTVPPSLDWAGVNAFQTIFILSGSTNIRVLKRAVDQVQDLVGIGRKPGQPAPPPKQ